MYLASHGHAVQGQNLNPDLPTSRPELSQHPALLPLLGGQLLLESR